MRVLFITHYSDLYGANRSLLALIEGLTKKKVKCCVVCNNEGHLTEKLTEMNIPYYIWPVQLCMARYNKRNRLSLLIRRNYETAVRLYKTLKQIPKLINKAKQWKVDIVYTNSSVTIAGIVLAKLIKKPHVWHIREFGKLDYDFVLDYPLWLFKKILKCSNIIVFVSKSLSNYYFRGINSKKIKIVYNGVANEKDFFLKKSRNVIVSEFVFLMVGLISQNKGQEEAIFAFNLINKRYPNTKLIIVGGGDAEDRKKQVFDLGLNDKVLFTGYVNNTKKYYLKADVLLMCSKHEAMGRVTAEAMTLGLPVIGKNSGGTAELIQHKKTGLLYDTNYIELSDMMMEIMINRKLYNEIKKEAFVYAKNNFTIEKYSNSIYEILKNIK